MTRSDATSCGDRQVTSAYETLRNDVLEGLSLSGNFGLVVLMREGVAAWMANCSVQPVMLTQRAAEATRAVPAPLVSDEIHADLVTLLANMVMETPAVRHA